MKPLHLLIAAFTLLASEARGTTIEQLYSASSTNPVDATWLITNPSFETGDETGWTLIGKDPNGNDEFKTRDYGMSGKDGQYLMNAYIKSGVDELGKDKLKTLLALKFGSVTEGISALGGTPQARQTFKDFQRRLYVG